MRNLRDTVGTNLTPDAFRAAREGIAAATTPGLLWTPAQGVSGLIVVARPRPLAAVIGGRIVQVVSQEASLESEELHTNRGRIQQVTLGGLVIISNSRQKEPTRVVGHPDLASGASVQRGEILYVSVAEAIYRETRGEDVEVHLTPTPEDAEALSDLRTRARNRWENDRLPDGWTRPLPPRPTVEIMPSPKEKAVTDHLPDELRALAERFRAKAEDTSD